MANKNSKIKVLVALSGGVDSSVAAALLVKAGYDVTAAYMVNYDDKKEQLTMNNEQAITSCWVPDYRDAVRVAAHLNIPIIKLDFTREYKEKVLDYMFAEYNSGRTPNPDVLCNKYVKFGVWLEKAKEMGFDYLATGHYARVKKLAISKKQLASDSLLVAHCSLLISNDSNKDQTYFLHQLSQGQLNHTMFPIGEYTKPEVRKLAAKFKLPTAEKEESMGICFIGEVPMKEFLEQRIPPKKGKIVLSDGTVVGTHDGLAFYTIGQRHIGLASPPHQGGVRGGLPSSKLPRANGVTFAQTTATPPNLPLERGGGDTRPLYVTGKNLEKNELIVGYENDPALYKKEIAVNEINWISGQEPKFPLKCEVRLRHRETLKECVVEASRNKEQGTIIVKFAKPERAVTPGQFAVFYKNGECLGGGTIA